MFASSSGEMPTVYMIRGSTAYVIRATSILIKSPIDTLVSVEIEGLIVEQVDYAWAKQQWTVDPPKALPPAKE